MAKIGKPKTTKAKKNSEIARRVQKAAKGERAPKPRRPRPSRKAISEMVTKIGAKKETPLIEKELGRELRNKPKTPNRRNRRAMKDLGKMAVGLLSTARNKKPRQGKAVGGDVMGAIRRRAEKAGFMTGQDDMRDIKEYLINERNKKMFDDAEKKAKKKKAKPKRRKPSKSTLDAARKAASNIRLKKGGYASHNKKYGGGIYPKVGK